MFLKHLKLTTVIAGVALTFGSFTALSSPATADFDYNYYSYDADRDGYLEETEYVDYSYDLIDYNDDNYVDEDEWDYYSSVWYEPYDSIDYDMSYDFDDYDTDNDGFIETTEYKNAYDADIFSAWDIDNNGYVEANEFDMLVDNYTAYDNNNVYTW